jgi:hypothetical protein
MYFKVKITKGLPQAKSGGFTGNNLNKQVISFGGADMNAASRHLENTRYLKQVPRDEANLEAEKGESAFGDINGDGFTEHMLIGGKRHSNGGTPLNLPDGTFIFSDTASMKIKDPEILAKFGKKSGSFTPAELAKPYDINKYRKILEDPNSDKIDKKSAELMIKNINLKLGALALAQESKKGFPQGIPEVAQPYMEQMGIREEDLIPQKPQPEAQVNAQAMNNPYENQGMGMQSPQEEMMEQGPGMQNPQEEGMEMPPMAQYGMAMGDYSRPAQQLYRNGGSLDKYQSKGEVKYDIPKDAVIINRGEYKTDEDYAVARNEKFAKAGKNPVYILMPDGKYKKVTQKTKVADPYTGEDLKTTWNNSEMVASQFKDMNVSINTPEFTKVLANYTRAAIKDEAKYKGKNQKTSKAFKDFSTQEFKDEEIRDAFAKHQKRNLALQANGIQARYFEDEPTGRLYTPEQMVAKKVLNDDNEPIKLAEAKQMYDKYKSSNITDLGKAFNKIGIPLDNTALEQATFQGFTDALANKEKLTKEEQAALSGWSGYETGAADETGQANARISPIDRVYTNTTGEQVSAYAKPAESEYVETDVEGKPVEAVAAEEIPEAPYVSNPQAWKQDKLNLLNAGLDYFDVDKALPWAARYEPELMTPTYYDPTRELAAQSEQANIANQALAQFTGPQALSARSASVQGQGAKQAADTLGRYNNLNVGIANQFEGNNTQIMNQAQQYNQAQNKQLYDQNVIANQQFKNTKRALRHNLGDAQNTLLTNMMKTDAMNQMYPNYAVDPSTGGRMHFTKGKSTLNPTYTQDTLAYANEINNSGLPEKVQQSLINDYIKRNSGLGDDGKPDMYLKKGGSAEMAYVMGSNVFPFMFY